MRVESREKPSALFGRLAVDDAFWYTGELYLKILDPEERPLALNLHTARARTLPDETEVDHCPTARVSFKT